MPSFIENNENYSLLENGDGHLTVRFYDFDLRLYFEHVVEFNGSPVTANQFGAAWEVIGVEMVGTKLQLAWKNAAANIYSMWTLNDDAQYVSSQIVSVDDTAAFERHFSQDLDGNGTIVGDYDYIDGFDLGEIYQELQISGGRLVIRTSEGDYTLVTLSGNGVAPDQFPGYAPQKFMFNADGTYQILWMHESGESAAIWTLSAEGAFSSSRVVSSSEFQALELEFNSDIDGDEQIGFTHEYIDEDYEFGEAADLTLFTLGPDVRILKRNNDEIGVTFNGSALQSDQFGTVWNLINIADDVDSETEETIYYLLWENESAGILSIWTLDKDGVFVSAETANNADLAAFSFQFDDDLENHNDRNIEYFVDTLGSEDLFVAESGFVFAGTYSNAEPILFNGRPLKDDAFGPDWTVRAIEPNADGTHKLVWYNHVLQIASVWTLNSDHEFVSAATVTADKLWQLDAEFAIAIGSDAPEYTTLTSGSSSLNIQVYEDGSVAFESDGHIGFLSFNGTPLTASQFGAAWKPVYTTTPEGGGYALLWHNASANLYSFHIFNTDGVFQSAQAVDWKEVAKGEELSGLDINNDGKIGYNLTSIEADGQLKLATIDDGSLVIRETVESSDQLEVFLNGAAVKFNQFGPDWAAVGVEMYTHTVTGSQTVLYLLWVNEAAGLTALWELDENGHFVDAEIQNIDLLWTYEEAIGADLDGDSEVGRIALAVADDGFTKLGSYEGGVYHLYDALGTTVYADTYIRYNGDILTEDTFGADWEIIDAKYLDGSAGEATYGLLFENSATNQRAYWEMANDGEMIAGSAVLITEDNASQYNFGEQFEGGGAFGAPEEPVNLLAATDHSETLACGCPDCCGASEFQVETFTADGGNAEDPLEDLLPEPQVLLDDLVA